MDLGNFKTVLVAFFATIALGVFALAFLLGFLVGRYL